MVNFPITYIMYLLQTHDLILKHIFAGWPGRPADGSVLKHSPLLQTLPPDNE